LFLKSTIHANYEAPMLHLKQVLSRCVRKPNHRAIEDGINIILAIGLGVGITFLPGCGSRSISRPTPSLLADVALYKPVGIEFDQFELRLEGKSPGTSQFSTKGTPSQNSLKATVIPGDYKIYLAYFKGGSKTFSSDYCPPGTRNDEKTLVPGPNSVNLMICDQEKKPTPTVPPQPTPKPQDPNSPPPSSGSGNSQNTSPGENDDTQVIINPTPRQPSSANQTFSIRGSQLIDPSGKNFLIRGVNNPHNYWPQQAYQSLPRIKELGFNSVRIVWCADNLIASGRCDQKDIQPASELEKILAKMRELQLVAVLNLQNATGSNDPKHLELMADYLLKPEIKKILMAYQDMLLINIANEWYGQWDKSSTYINTYRTVIQKLRREQLPHVLLVDARGWGQDMSSVIEHANDFKAIDSNLMISAHMYDLFSTKKVADTFSFIRQNNLPFIIGEFGCSHGKSKIVACTDIIKEASRSSVGLLAWSYSGNSEELKDLDITEQNDWNTLTSYGRMLVSQASSFRRESKTACSFNRSENCQ
jgi:mannan endo-1,4-beta-mannosidase